MTFFKKFCTFKAFFTAFCTLAVILMISYWMYKYYNDEDLCLVDYKPIEELQEESLPILSLCYYHPFIKDKQINTKFNDSHYVEHLKGNVHEENFKHIQYKMIALNLQNSIAGFYIGWRNGSTQLFESKNVPYMVNFLNTFNGFFHGDFINCFGLGVNEEYKKDIAHSTVFFVRDDDLDSVLANPGIPGFTIIHYPNQFRLVSINYKNLDMDANRTVNSDVYYTVDSIEILKRRNKFREPCKSQENFDKIMIEKQIAKVGCRPPYLTGFDDYPICNTQDEMKMSKIDFSIIKNKKYVRPCLGMSKVDFQYSPAKSWLAKTWFGVGIVYPEQMKIISQSQAVDFHSLIGNIGGYIGLFLGITT